MKNNILLFSSFLLIMLLPLFGACGTERAESNSAVNWSNVFNKRIDIASGWKYIVIHHSGTKNGNANSFHRYHTKMGYGGLCYHFVIGNGHGAEDGSVVEGFRWKQQISGTHVSVNAWYYNIFGIGICLVGNFNNQRPTPKQLKALTKLVRTLSRRYNIPRSRIFGHSDVPRGEVTFDSSGIKFKIRPNEYEKSSCPGKLFPWSKLIKNVFGSRS